MNIVLYADPARVYHEMITTTGIHYSTFPHPFFALISQSCISLIKSLVQSTRFSSIIFVSLSAVSSVFLLKKCIEKITDNSNAPLIISAIYGFSFSTLIFGTMPETYLTSALTNLLMIYYIVHLIKSEVKSLNNKDLFILIGLGFLNFGILFSNIFLDIIHLIFLLINIYQTNIKKIIFMFLKIVGIFFIVVMISTLLQKLVFPTHDLVFYHHWISAPPLHEHFDFNYNMNELLYCIKSAYFNCFYGFNLQNVYLRGINRIVIAFEHAGWFKIVPVLLFYSMILFNFIKNQKQFLNKKIYKYIFLLIFILCFCLLSNLSYWPEECFLYGQTTLIPLMLLCGIIFSSAEDKISEYICYFLIAVELLQNTRVFRNIIYPQIAAYNTQSSYNVFLPFLYSIITCSIFVGLFFLVKKLINKDILNGTLENKFFITLLFFFGYMFLFIVFNGMFINLEECNFEFPIT